MEYSIILKISYCSRPLVIGTAIRLGLEPSRIEPEEGQGWAEGSAKARQGVGVNEILCTLEMSDAAI